MVDCSPMYIYFCTFIESYKNNFHHFPLHASWFIGWVVYDIYWISCATLNLKYYAVYVFSGVAIALHAVWEKNNYVLQWQIIALMTILVSKLIYLFILLKTPTLVELVHLFSLYRLIPWELKKHYPLSNFLKLWRLWFTYA